MPVKFTLVLRLAEREIHISANMAIPHVVPLPSISLQLFQICRDSKSDLSQ